MWKFGMIAAIAVVALSACEADEGHSPRESGTSPTATVEPAGTAESALTTSGPPLRICVDVSPAVGVTISKADAALRVRDGWPEYARLFALSAEAHEKAGAGRDAYGPLSPLEIDAGCPEGYLPPPDEMASSVKPRCTDSGSPYHLHVFLAERSELGSRLRPASYWMRVAYEIGQCSGHTAAELSGALFMVPKAAADPVLAGWALGDAFGFTTILRYPCGHPSDELRCQGISPPQP